jgi:uncharacterized protein YgiM (DUF1202 family)
VRFEALLRSGIATVTIAGVGAAFLILGVAAVSWRTQCASEPGAGICFGAPAEEPVTPGAVAGPEFKASAAVAAEVVPAALVPEQDVTEVAVAPSPLPSIVPEASAAEPALAVVASAPQPVLVPAGDAPTAGEVAAMMASTFEALTEMKNAVNAAAVTGEPVKLPSSEQLAASSTVETAEVSPAAPAATPDTTTAVPDVEVAAVDPAAEASVPLQRATALAAPGNAPTTRTVKIIPITPVSLPATPATAAANAAASAAPSQDIPLGEPDALAFANSAGTATPAKTLEVNDNLVNVRAGPSTEFEKLWVLKRHDEVRALAVAGDWVEVEISDGKSGWILSQFLTDADLSGLPQHEVPAAPATQVASIAEPVAAEPEAAAPDQLVAEAASETGTELSGDVRTVLGSGVNVRSGPSSSSGKLFALPPGRKVSVLESQRGWLKVTDDKGRTGWLYKDYVTGG